jgi:poly(3-hydroxybutyrate) depolymerase
MRGKATILSTLRLSIAFAILFTCSAEELRTASGHSIQYYVSLPQGWTAARKWAVVVVIESANRQFQETLAIFVKARKDMPFILVAPLVTTNGGANYRQAETYHYSDAVWSEIARDRCGFDADGIAAAVADVRKLYGGEDRYFLTGWEAGGHTVWSIIFEHPDALRAAAPAVSNYAGRCLESGFSTSPARAELPVTVFQVASGRDVAPGTYVYRQSQQAMKIAEEHGYRKVSERIVADKPHGPLAEEVLAYFASTWNGRRALE